MTKIPLAFLALMILFSRGSAQTITWVADTVYTRVIQTDSFLLLHNQNEAVFVTESGLDPFTDPVTASYNIRGFSDDNIFIQTGGRCYLLRPDQTLFPPEGLDLDLRKVELQTLTTQGDWIAYRTHQDSIFLINLRTLEKTMAQPAEYFSMDNDQYFWSWIEEDAFTRDEFLYNISAGKLFKLPAGFYHLSAVNKNLIVGVRHDGEWDGQLQALDLNGREVIGPDENYKEFIADKDRIVFFGRGKPAKAYYQGKEVPFPKDVIRVNLSSVQNPLLRIESRTGKKGLVDTTLQVVYPAQYRVVDTGPQSSEYWTLCDTDSCQVIGPEGKVVFSGAYQNVRFLTADRFAVQREGKWAVVDEKNEVVIPDRQGGRLANFFLREDYGRRFFMYSVNDDRQLFDYDGDLMMEWNAKQEGEYVHSLNYLQGYPKSLIAALTPDQEKRINRLGAWLMHERIGTSHRYRLENREGTPLTQWYPRIRAAPIVG